MTSKGFFDGEIGDSIFVKPFFSISSIYESNQTIPPLFKLMEKSGDDRSFSIVTASIVESQLDKMLQSLMPDYDTIEEDLTLDLKIRLLSGLKLIPPRIIRCATCIRKIRNAFAHEFQLESLEKLKQEEKDRLISSYKEFYNENDLKTKSPRQLFSSVAFIAIAGLSAYQLNTDLLRNTIQSPQFLTQLEEESKKKFKEEEENIMKTTPVVEHKDGLKVERFEKGVTKITSVPDTDNKNN